MTETNSDLLFMRLKRNPSNTQCFECKSSESSWCSVNLGIFLCLKCAGQHRSLGVHLSFVRSLTMDSFNPKQLSMMSVGGNQALSEFFEYYSLNTLPLDQKYRTVAAFFYREKLSFASEGIFIDKQRPSVEDGRQILEETPKVSVFVPVDQPKGTFSAILDKTMETTKELKDKMTEISMKDVEDKVRESIHSAGIKEKISKAKKSAGKFYNSIASGAKNVFKHHEKDLWYEGKLIPGEDELMLDPENVKAVNASN